MKFAVLVPNLSGGGAEFVAREWCKELVRRGHEVTVLVSHPKASDKDHFAGQIVALRGKNLAVRIVSARSAIKAAGPDVVLALLPAYNLTAVLATRGLRPRPFVAVSGRNVEAPFPSVHGRHYRITRALSRLLFPRADRFIAISHPVAAEAIALFGLDPFKVRVVPNPAAAKVIAARLTSVAPAVSSLDPETLNLVVPGRITAQKRPSVAVDSARALMDRGHAVTLHFFGAGELESGVRAKAIQREVDAHFHGWKENWFEHVGGRAVVLLPSLVEGFGNVFVEAAAVGIPSVASSGCLGAADAIVPGITGELVGGSTANDFADGVEAALAIGTVDATGWIERFSPSRSADELLKALK